MKNRLKPYIKTVLGCLLVVGTIGAVTAISVAPQSACAQPSGSQPPTPCDPQYMDALEARAWLEAQREISQNQNLIVKPDSVLEYTCFNLFLNVVARDAEIFSETSRWGSIPGLDSTSTDSALQRMVGSALAAYITTNFPHTFLGGRATADGNVVGTVSGGTYACNAMSRVWQEATCMNMFDETSFDGFYDFQWYQNQDPRQLPGNIGGDDSNFAVCQPPSDGTYMYSNMQSIAFNQRHETYVLQTENPNDATQYNVDRLVTFLNFILPQGVAPAMQCAEPIRTGVRVARIGQAAYDDAVCPNPGCYYTGSGGSCQPGGG